MTLDAIDGHRHIMCREAHEIANRLDPTKANSMTGVGEASAMVNTQKLPDWIRKMTDVAETIDDMDVAGINMAVIWPVRPQKPFLPELR